MVKKAKLVVIWNNSAAKYFKTAYQRIKEDSPVNAEKVRDGIVKIIDSLPAHPEKYPPDKFKRSNPGNCRAFELYSFRVAYTHNEKEIRILRIRHVKQEPKDY
jgi:plasmid stabilization system protein ParE